MPSELSLQRAARAWCFPETERKTMDPELTYAFAKILDGRDEMGLGLYNEIRSALNRASRENESNTPDFILANYLISCLEAFEVASTRREKWYGKKLEIDNR